MGTEHDTSSPPAADIGPSAGIPAPSLAGHRTGEADPAQRLVGIALLFTEDGSRVTPQVLDTHLLQAIEQNMGEWAQSGPRHYPQPRAPACSFSQATTPA
jgi:hypothetical protein